MKEEELNFYLVPSGSSLKEVMIKITQGGERAAIVIDASNHLLGLVTDGDIRRSITNGASIDDPIEKFMNAAPLVAKKGYLPSEIAELVSVKDRYIEFLPVVDSENVIVDILFKKNLINILERTKGLLFVRDKIIHIDQKILVVGGAGYIGSVLTRELLRKGYKVAILDKLLFGEEHLQGFLNNPNFTLIKGDISNIEIIVKSIEDVDAVVHLAEIVGDPACALDPRRTQQINYLSTAMIAKVCKYFQVSRFIYTSSCSVYGAANDVLLTEDSPLNPVSLYARMKINSEQTILELADEVFSPTILRLSTVFGQSPRMRFDLVVNLLTAKALKENKITIFGGNQWRPNIHVADVTEAIIKVLESPIGKVHGEIFNVGSNDNNLTINEIGKIIKVELPQADLIVEDKNVDKRDYKVDFSKIRNTLGFMPKRDIKYGIREIVKGMNDGLYEDYFSNKKYSNHKTYQEIFD